MSLTKELKIIKDHWYFRIVKRVRPWSIHTECLHKDNIWDGAKKFVHSGRHALWFVVTPVNYEFVKTESGIQTGKKEWEKTLLKRYKWLQDMGEEIQIHVHLRVKMHLYPSLTESKRDIKNKISEGVAWLRNNGFEVNKIVFGWWSYNNYAEKIAKSRGLDVIKRLDYYFIHDYDFINLRM